MRKFFLWFAVLALLLHGVPPYIQAKTGYVSDILILTFREGPAKDAAVKKSLPSDTPLTILEEQDGYLNVQLDSGETGWVEKQYVVYDLPKRIVIEDLTRQKQALEKKLETVEAALANHQEQIAEQAQATQGKTSAMAAQVTELQKKNDTLEKELTALRKEYDTLVKQSGDVHQIVQKNEALTRENKQLAADIAFLENQTGLQFKTGMIKWFLAGVGVLLLGWILGHSVSSKRKRKNSLLD